MGSDRLGVLSTFKFKSSFNWLDAMLAMMIEKLYNQSSTIRNFFAFIYKHTRKGRQGNSHFYLSTNHNLVMNSF